MPLISVLFPRYTVLDLSQVEARALVVRGVEPKHAAEGGDSFVEAAQTPEAEAVAVEATQVWAVVDQTPRKNAFEIGSEG
jgi:hypothetical protein